MPRDFKGNFHLKSAGIYGKCSIVLATVAVDDELSTLFAVRQFSPFFDTACEQLGKLI
jgi:hypothetical protein